VKISETFSLNRTQSELDFVDIDTSGDLPLFLDPFFLGLRKDKWSIESTLILRSFFQDVINKIRGNQIDEAKLLFEHLEEPNTTCLGMSQGQPMGRGVGPSNADDVFDNIIGSQAIQTGLLQDLEDTVLFVRNFGKDKLSDMTTNIIKKQLIIYTQNQCRLHGIAMRQDVPTGFFWSRQNMRWEQELDEMLVISGRVILLVPKGVVSFSKKYTAEQYYNKFILEFMQNEHLSMNSTLVQERRNGVRFVTKKSIKEQHPFSKEFLADFTRRHGTVLGDFKFSTKDESLTNQELPSSIGTDVSEIKTRLINELNAIEPGNSGATKFHRLITAVLELLFYPKLLYPTLEREIHDGRKRIDLTFDNAAESGIFSRLGENMNLHCPYIMVECKNYTADLNNPEFDQLSGRFSPGRGRVGFLICRTVSNAEAFIGRARDTYRDNRGLIVPLVDSDIIALLTNYDNWNDNFIDSYLSDKIRQIAIN